MPVRLGVMFLLAVGFAAAAPGATAQAPLPIAIGYQPGVDTLLFTAKELKLFERAGLAPKYVKFGSGPPMIAAAEQKTIDVAVVGSVPFLVGLSRGVDWVTIGISLEGAYAEGIVARADSGIATLADLKGKRIGYYRGTTQHYALLLMLRQVGLRPDQVTLLDMPADEQVAAMAKKDLDAAMAGGLMVPKLVHEANARIIAMEGDLAIYTNVGNYSVRRDWLGDNRETAIRFLQALLMASAIVQEDPVVGIRALAGEMGISEAWAETIYWNAPPPKINEWANARYNYSLVKGSAYQRRLAHVAAFLLNENIVAKPVGVRDALDASIIAEAQRRR